MKKGRNWSWREGTVDRTSDHFELRYGSADDSGWDGRVPVALLGPPINGVFDVQFLIDTGNESQAQAVRALIKELDFYLIELNERDPWKYARYHATTVSNAMSSIHWSFFPKRPTKEKAESEPRHPKQLDLGVTENRPKSNPNH